MSDPIDNTATIAQLRQEIADAAALLDGPNYPSVGGGALMAATAAQCDQLAALVPHTLPHKWFILGMGFTYCMLCGIQQPAGYIETPFTITAHYGINQTEIQIDGQVSTACTSISEIYYSLHVPSSANVEKTSFEVASTSKVRVELIADQADGSCFISLNVTTGASANQVDVGVTVSGSSTSTFSGVTGTPMTITL